MNASITAVYPNNNEARNLDFVQPSLSYVTTALPVIDWAGAGQKAPVRLAIGTRAASDPLPYADWVVITWTSAEWQAMDHVFLNSGAKSSDHPDWKKDWHQYSRAAADFPADAQSGALWGQFQLVQITDRSNRPWRVLLFKSNSHLAHSPWVAGLSAMMRCILADTRADRVYTIGTAGGARLDQRLGDAVMTNSAVLELQRPQNTKDSGNGNSYRCPSWYPSNALNDTVQEKLLLKLNSVATPAVFESLLKDLKSSHAGDPSVQALTLADLLNEGLDPVKLGSPKIQSLQDVPLLSTDFYYIANGNSAAAYAFLEMDDAIIAREANAMGVRFACIRNISDPVVPDKTKGGVTISDVVRGDWSGLIYKNFGLYTSFNGALATWGTIAGEGSALYNPLRNTPSPAENDPIEIKLAYNVRSCGSCSFFWPEDKQKVVYGPYTAFDFDVDTPYVAVRPRDAATADWVLGRTRPPSFPNGEIVDGCRKAPIMTIGINPNLTAFAPGQNGAAWAYPNFSSDDNTSAWTKYAWYYRYRSVYQEKVSLDFIRRFILPEGQHVAMRDGKIISVTRSDAGASWSFHVRYQGDAGETVITVQGAGGDFPTMLLFDTFEPNNIFHAGDILAGKVAVPEGIQVEILQEQQGYYMQFVPTLDQFQRYLQKMGHGTANLKIGEDVAQLDMVACASPHWTEAYLGNEMKTIVDNCVSKNAWAIKQLVQTQPAILYIVSESSWDMFYDVVGNFVEQGKIPAQPEDQSYTLLRATTNLADPVYLNLDVTVDGMRYQSKTRLVITPHFSFGTNFLPQYRINPNAFDELAAAADFITAITEANGFTILAADPAHPDYFREIQLKPDTAAADRERLKNSYPGLWEKLEVTYYDAHALMASVLTDMYDKGEISYDDAGNYLKRTAGGCKFCVNQYWQFGCKYGKPAEPSPPAGYLEKVADAVIAKGKPNLA